MKLPFGLTAYSVRLLILLSILLLIASCRRGGGNAINSNSVVLSPRQSPAETRAKKPCLNLNTATNDELISLPGIGEVLAGRVIDYRQSHGRFKRPEEIIIIEGFSERKYRAIADSLCVE